MWSFFVFIDSIFIQIWMQWPKEDSFLQDIYIIDRDFVTCLFHMTSIAELLFGLIMGLCSAQCKFQDLLFSST